MWVRALKAHTHTLILTGLAVESAVELADSNKHLNCVYTCYHLSTVYNHWLMMNDCRPMALIKHVLGTGH